MALVLNQLVRVRVAVVLTVAGDFSVAQVYDEPTSTWTDVVWITSSLSYVLPQEFGDVEYYGHVTALSLTRSSVTRPAVTIYTYITGGVKATEFRALSEGSDSSIDSVLLNNGSDIITTLPGLGAITNKARIYGYGLSRTGWVSRLPSALTWTTSYNAIMKSLIGHGSYLDSIPTVVSGFSPTISDFNSWLATNLPDWGSPFYLVFNHVLPLTVQATYVIRTTYSMELRCAGYSDGSSSHGYYWNTYNPVGPGYSTCASLSRSVNYYPTASLTVDPCPALPPKMWTPRSYDPSVVANASSGVAAARPVASTSGSFPLPAAGGGVSNVALWIDAGYTIGVTVSLTVTAQGKISGIALTPNPGGSTVSGWAAMLTETGGMV